MNGHCVVDFEIINDALGCKIGLKLAGAPEGSSVRVLFGLSAVDTYVFSDLVESSCAEKAGCCTGANESFVQGKTVDGPTWLILSASGRCPLTQVVDAAEITKAVEMLEGANKMLAFHMVWTNSEVTDPAALSGH